MADQSTLQQSTVMRRHESGQRTGPAADWAALNPILGKGEIGLAADTLVLKVGDGTTPWNTLSEAHSGTYSQSWTTPAASTTLTGTLAPWVVTVVDCTAGPGARTLPLAASVPAKTEFCAKKGDTSSNNLVVTTSGSEVIFGTGAGSASKTLALAGEAVTFVSDGVSRYTVRSSDTPSSALATTYAGKNGAARVPASQRPIDRPTVRLLSTRLARYKPKVYATNVAPSGATSAVTFTGVEATTPAIWWGSPQYTIDGSGYFQPYDPSQALTHPHWRAEFITDSPLFAIDCSPQGGAFQVDVNDQVIATAFPAGGSYLAFDWSTVRKLRRYRLWGTGGFKIKQWLMNPTDSLYAPQRQRRSRWLWVGDSFSQASASDGLSSIPHLVGDMLDWEMLIDAQGGTGYAQTANGTPTGSSAVGWAFEDSHRTSLLVGNTIDGIILAGGHNFPAGTYLTTTRPALVSQVNTLRGIAPGVPVLCLGPFWSNSVDPATYPGQTAAIVGGCADLGGQAKGVTYIPTDNWITGTGYAGNLKNDGNGDVMIDSGAVHPNATYGVPYIASRVAEAITGCGGI